MSTEEAMYGQDKEASAAMDAVYAGGDDGHVGHRDDVLRDQGVPVPR